MDQEIKRPELDKPKFFHEPYDYRNIENVGQYRGVGQAGKIGSKGSNSIYPMPQDKSSMRVPRDFEKSS